MKKYFESCQATFFIQHAWKIHRGCYLSGDCKHFLSFVSILAYISTPSSEIHRPHHLEPSFPASSHARTIHHLFSKNRQAVAAFSSFVCEGKLCCLWTVEGSGQRRLSCSLGSKEETVSFWGCGSVTEYLARMYKALGSLPAEGWK